jgi:predicted nucleotidyltransferase
MVIKMSNVGQLYPDILRPYLRDYSLKMSASEISRNTKLERRTVSRFLNNLFKMKLLNYVSQGKNKLFYFDLDKNTSFSLINLIEINNSLDFEFKNKEVSLIISKILDFSEGVIVFGSYASGNNKDDSDLDLVLIGKVNLGEIKKIKSFSPIKINEHVVSFSEFRKILKDKNPLSIEISKNHVLFGDFSKMVKIFLEDKKSG